MTSLFDRTCRGPRRAWGAARDTDIGNVRDVLIIYNVCNAPIARAPTPPACFSSGRGSPSTGRVPADSAVGNGGPGHGASERREGKCGPRPRNPSGRLPYRATPGTRSGGGAAATKAYVKAIGC